MDAPRPGAAPTLAQRLARRLAGPPSRDPGTPLLRAIRRAEDAATSEPRPLLADLRGRWPVGPAGAPGWTAGTYVLARRRVVTAAAARGSGSEAASEVAAAESGAGGSTTHSARSEAPRAGAGGTPADVTAAPRPPEPSPTAADALAAGAKAPHAAPGAAAERVVAASSAPPRDAGAGAAVPAGPAPVRSRGDSALLRAVRRILRRPAEPLEDAPPAAPKPDVSAAPAAVPAPPRPVAPKRDMARPLRWPAVFRTLFARSVAAPQVEPPAPTGGESTHRVEVPGVTEPVTELPRAADLPAPDFGPVRRLLRRGAPAVTEVTGAPAGEAARRDVRAGEVVSVREERDAGPSGVERTAAPPAADLPAPGFGAVEAAQRDARADEEVSARGEPGAEPGGVARPEAPRAAGLPAPGFGPLRRLLRRPVPPAATVSSAPVGEPARRAVQVDEVAERADAPTMRVDYGVPPSASVAGPQRAASGTTPHRLVLGRAIVQRRREAEPVAGDASVRAATSAPREDSTRADAAPEQVVPSAAPQLRTSATDAPASATHDSPEHRTRPGAAPAPSSAGGAVAAEAANGVADRPGRALARRLLVPRSTAPDLAATSRTYAVAGPRAGGSAAVAQPAPGGPRATEVVRRAVDAPPAPATTEAAPPPPDGAGVAGTAATEPDVTGLAEKVYELLVRRLASERERRGL